VLGTVLNGWKQKSRGYGNRYYRNYRTLDV
jgi:hypothetical protein